MMINNKYMIRDLGVPIFAQNSKFFWESAGGAALISGIGGLFGSGSSAAAAKAQAEAARYAADMQYKATQETNQANIQIAQEANQNNYKMFQEQNQWNLDQWNRENEYNSASQQRQRLEDAGLNPYLMMSGGSAGTASSITSASPTPTVTPTMQTPDMSLYAQTGFSGAGAALSGLGSLFQSGVQGYMQGAQLTSQMSLQDAQKQKVESETQFQNIQNMFAALKEALYIKKTNKEIEGLGFDNFVKDLQGEILKETKDFIISKSESDAAISAGDAKLKGGLAKYSDEFALEELTARKRQNDLTLEQIRSQKAQQRLYSRQWYVYKAQEEQILKQNEKLDEEIKSLKRDNENADKLNPERVANMLKNEKLRGLLLDNQILDEQMALKYGKDWRSKLLRNIDKYSKSSPYDFTGQVKYARDSILLYFTDLFNGMGSTLGSAISGVSKVVK